jgi:hypothetical protein
MGSLQNIKEDKPYGKMDIERGDLLGMMKKMPFLHTLLTLGFIPRIHQNSHLKGCACKALFLAGS